MTTIVLLFIVLAFAALMWWGVNRLTLPEPFKTVIMVIIGVVLLLMLYQWVAGGGMHSFSVR